MCYTWSTVYYSATVQSDTTAAQKIYNKQDQRRYSAPRYEQAVRNNVQVVAKYNVYHLARQPTASTQQREL